MACAIRRAGGEWGVWPLASENLTPLKLHLRRPVVHKQARHQGRFVSMERTRSNAIVVIRVLGLAGVVMGVIWLVNLATSILLIALEAPSEILHPIYFRVLQGLISGPLLLLAGVLTLRKSGHLAAFIVKGAKDDAT